MAEAGSRRPFRMVLALGGGNALGAYHAGLYQALHEHGLMPDWIVCTSIGAVNGAIIAGNPPERRIDLLRALWRPADVEREFADPWTFVPDEWRRTGAALWTLIAGRPGMFAPLGPLGSWWTSDSAAASPALYDTKMLQATLDGAVDFALLNGGPMRFTALAVDLQTGDEVAFDTARRTVGAEHIRASAALLTAYPAVVVDGRTLVDGGLSSNLPLDPVLAEPGDEPILCIAADLLPLTGAIPTTLGETIGRMQDLAFAAQSRRTIERWQAIYAGNEGAHGSPSVTLARVAYSDQAPEVAGKAMDFSPASVRHRWATGYSDMQRMIGRIDSGEIAIGAPGLTVFAG